MSFVGKVLLDMHPNRGGGLKNGVGIRLAGANYAESKLSIEVYFADSYDKAEDKYPLEIHLPSCSNSGSGS